MPVFIIPIGNGLKVVMRGVVVARDTSVGDRHTVMQAPFYYGRADEENMVLIPPSCENAPMSFHACVTLLGRLLPVMHSTPQVYEDGEDFTINPRQLIQSTAFQYGVEPNDMTGHYAMAKTMLGHRDITHPATLEVGLTNLQMRATSSTTIKRFH